MTSIDLRLAALERAQRRSRLLVTGLCLALASLVTLGAGRPSAADPVRASAFELVDEKGVVRGSFMLEDKQHPSLAILDAQGRKRWQILLKDDELFSYMRDNEGRGRITHAIDRANHPHFLLHDKGNKPRIHAAIADSGAPSMMFIHQDGTMPAGLGIHADGRGWMRPEGGSMKPADKPAEAPAAGKDDKK